MIIMSILTASCLLALPAGLLPACLAAKLQRRTIGDDETGVICCAHLLRWDICMILRDWGIRWSCWHFFSACFLLFLANERAFDILGNGFARAVSIATIVGRFTGDISVSLGSASLICFWCPLLNWWSGTLLLPFFASSDAAA